MSEYLSIENEAEPADISLAEIDAYLEALNGPSGDQPDTATPIIFEPLRAFLERDLPPNESLVGVARDGTNLLPRYGWVMPWGREGSGKTSILVDLIFHACSGIDWLGYPIERELRIVVVINEGVPGGLQDKLRQKQERWEHGDQVLDNLAIYASPWGEFTFRNQQATDHARDYAIDFCADYFALDPLHTLGTTGAGAPAETEEFKHLLRAFGLWQDLGVITAHHANKGGMVSGDWARHPDTVIHLEKDGKAPATKLTLQKARPADPAELGNPFLLEWETATLGYTRIELNTVAQVSDHELLERIKTTLQEATTPLTMNDLKAETEGTNTRIGNLAKQALETGEIANLSNSKGRYRFVLAKTVRPGDEPNEPFTGNEAQTRMDTAIEQFGHPDEPSELTPQSGETVRRVVHPVGVATPNRTDAVNPDDDIPF